MNNNNSESKTSLYRVLMSRFQDLEASQAKLTDQFEVLKQETETEHRKRREVWDPSWGLLTGFYSCGRPYRKVLDSIGHAVHVSRASDGKIIYWNRAAEALFGWNNNEVLGKRDADLIIDEDNHVLMEKIMERLNNGQSWSGQFLFKKRSGQIFMALATKSPLYEDGELVAVITVSSDAAVFNIMNSENIGTYQHHDYSQPRERKFNMKKIQWPLKPPIASVPQLTSSVSNLASKVFSRQHGDDDTSSTTTSSRSRGESAVDTEDTGLLKTFKMRIRRNNTNGNSGGKDESILGFVQPSKIAEKVLEKLNIGGSSNGVKDDCKSVPPCASAEIPARSNMGSDLDFSRSSRDTSLNIPNVGIKEMRADTDKINSINSNEQKHTIGKALEVRDAWAKDSDATTRDPFIASWLEGHECYGMAKYGIPFPGLAPEQYGKEELQCNPEILSKDLEAEVSVHQPLQVNPSPKLFSPAESSCSSLENSTNEDKDMDLIIDCGINWEELQVGAEIGNGSFAVVYRGVWIGSDVAIKVYFVGEIPEATLADYKKEIAIMKKLRHPNVLLFMGAVYAPERPAIVTEFLPRGSLFQALHRNNQGLDVRRRLQMALDVARGVNYLHRRNPPIVHRDLKSSNLLVGKNWTVKVGDFGLSKWKNATYLTAKSGRGTPQWMAPEVLRNEPSNEKSDVYSFGVILWELLTESVPWADLNSLQVVGVVGFMDRRLDLPESLDPRLSSIINDCWKSDPESRPSFQDLIERVTDLMRTIPATTAQRAQRNSEL